MNRIKKIHLTGLFLFLFLGGISFAQEEGMVEIKKLLEQNSNFSLEQIQTVFSLLDNANKKDLPVEFLVNRVKEGIARKANFQAIIKVINQKIEKLKLADGLIKDCLDKGIKVRNLDYSRQVLGELLERGLSADDFKDLSNLAILRKMDLDELTKVFQVLVELIERGIPVEYAKEVVTLALIKKMDIKRMEKTANLFLEAKIMHVSPEEVKEIIVEGINQGLTTRRIRENIEEVSLTEELRERIKREEKREISEELRERGWEEREEKGRR
ncbi:MAG: hypothetical protein ACE5IT_02480 [bacterium]